MFVRRLEGGAASRRTRPCVVVLDTSSVHHSQPVKAALPDMETAAVHLWFLPAYSPELNPIERVWRHVKDHDIPERSHPTDTAQHAMSLIYCGTQHRFGKRLC